MEKPNLSKIIFLFSFFLFVSSLTLFIFVKLIPFPNPPNPPTPPLLSSSRQTTTIIRTVHDGDTIYSADFKAGIRLIGINAPEIAGYTSKTNECGATEATAKLKNLVLNKQVVLVEDKLDKVDAYGRLLRYIYLCPTPTSTINFTMNSEPITLNSLCQDVNLEMIKSGFAKENAYRKHFEKEKEYVEAGKKAKGRKLGIWEMCKN